MAMGMAGQRVAGGPLAEEVPPNAVTFSVTPGVAFTYGGLQLRNGGTGNAVIEGVRLVRASGGLRIESAVVLPVSRTDGGLWFSYQAYPPPGLRVERLEPLAGYSLAAGGDEVQVLLALTVPAAGTYEFHGLAVRYVGQGRRYEAAFPFAMRVCAPMVGLGGCPSLAARE